MESDFSKVSLGFAEFVSQLIHETFDAILDSQNYQIDKYLGLEKALNTSNSDYKEKYLGDDEINEFLLEELGFEIKPNLVLNENQAIILNNILSKIESNEMIKSKLTSTQFGLIYNSFLEILVNEKKAKIKMFVERPELARLVVDSGEIKAKLNLFFLNESSKQPSSNPKRLEKPKPSIQDKTSSNSLSFDLKKLDFSKSQNFGKYTALKAKELVDKETGNKIVLIDKESLKDKEINFNIPTTRIVANPISSSNSSAISSEVIIKFRSI